MQGTESSGVQEITFLSMRGDFFVVELAAVAFIGILIPPSQDVPQISMDILAVL